MNQFAGLRKGRLNIGVITSLQCIDFGGMLSSFFVNYPKIDANIIQSGTHDLLNKLGERTLDVAFLNHPVSNLPTSVEFYKLGEATTTPSPSPSPIPSPSAAASGWPN